MSPAHQTQEQEEWEFLVNFQHWSGSLHGWLSSIWSNPVCVYMDGHV